MLIKVKTLTGKEIELDIDPDDKFLCFVFRCTNIRYPHGYRDSEIGAPNDVRTRQQPSEGDAQPHFAVNQHPRALPGDSSTRSSSRFSIPCVHPYRASPVMTITLPAGRYSPTFRDAPFPSARTLSNCITQPEPRLTPMMPSSYRSSRSTCGVMPSPGQ
ncbi:hypothetical protein A0H81_09571 [Grifola frondosa]|uniref:Ubiquitin-like domain-containing protein n=1 Tax=Grifola frondosa TaxID=5627 RepID=A0A1C7M285_GRIFR|nr:hypothetical protein A0H81_09571 [Grifola frondosa]